METVRRREVLRMMAQVPVAVALASGLAACGAGMSSDSSNSSSSTAASACDGIVPTMDLHTHPTCLTQADLQAGNPVTLQMEAGNTGHTHQVTLTANDLQTLQTMGSTAVETSTPGGGGPHTHQVTFTS